MIGHGQLSLPVCACVCVCFAIPVVRISICGSVSAAVKQTLRWVPLDHVTECEHSD